MNNIYEMLIRRSRRDESDSSSSSSVTPVLPTDYSNRYPLTANLLDEKHSGNTDYNLVKPSTAGASYGAVDGITGCTVTNGCLYNSSKGSTSITAGGALSVWCRMSAVPASSAEFKCFVNAASGFASPFAIGYLQGVYTAAYQATNVAYLSTSVSPDTSWHNLVLNYDASNLLIQLWIDGVKQAEATLSGAITKSTGLVVNAGVASNSTSPDEFNDTSTKYAYVTAFGRPLTEAEIMGLAQELQA